MNDIQLGPIITTALPIVISYIAAHVIQWKKYTGKLHEIREAVDDIDDSVTNPQISNAQFQKDWADFKALIS